ncbi:Rdx family protein (plasmid) [Halorussus limi]|uniref:Rdx family protein n=1 Tax=Halorussus limi TaxID=2938695 RepID=A0A8U0I0Y8_9EURY|nr:Rdx family protein [Halorussus limi]UPV76571.1 Rdx family protein [Halorussus limi]
MTSVEIEYCVPCGMLDRAQDVQHALLSEYGERLDSVALVTGDSGVFEVRADGEQVFDKDEDEFDVDAIVESVGQRASA